MNSSLPGVFTLARTVCPSGVLHGLCGSNPGSGGPQANDRTPLGLVSLPEQEEDSRGRSPGVCTVHGSCRHSPHTVDVPGRPVV